MLVGDRTHSKNTKSMASLISLLDKFCGEITCFSKYGKIRKFSCSDSGRSRTGSKSKFTTTVSVFPGRINHCLLHYGRSVQGKQSFTKQLGLSFISAGLEESQQLQQPALVRENPHCWIQISAPSWYPWASTRVTGQVLNICIMRHSVHCIIDTIFCSKCPLASISWVTTVVTIRVYSKRSVRMLLTSNHFF